MGKCVDSGEGSRINSYLHFMLDNYHYGVVPAKESSMEPPPVEFPKILEKAGFSFAGLHKITFGPGVVGKLTTSFIAVSTLCALAMCAGLYRNDAMMIYVSLGIAVASFLFTAVASMLFAARNPAIALLEGAALVNYHQVEAGMRGIPSPPVEPNIQPPRIEGGKRDDENI